MKLFFRVFLAAFVLIVAAVIAVPFLVSPTFIADQISAQVKERTGRTLTFGGKPSLSIFPNLAVTLNDAKLSNPPGLPQGTFVAMDALRLKVALKPLLQRRVDVKEFVLKGPKVNLLVAGNGKVNWSFADALASNAATDEANTQSGSTASDVANALTPTDIKLGPVKIENGTVLYLDERSGGSFKASKVNLDINAPRIGGPIAVVGSLVWKKQLVNLSVKVPDPLKLANNGASKLQLTASAKPLALGYAGIVSLKNGFELNGGINAKSPNLRALAQWTGRPFAPGNGLGPFAIKAKLKYGADKLALSGASLSLDKTNAQGSIVVSLKSNVPVLSARLGVDQINVNTYMSGSEAASGSGSENAATPASGWSTKPIDLSGLKAGAANLALTAARITYRKTTLSNVNLDLKLQGGVLTANLKKMGLYGGRASGRLVLNGSKNVPAISGNLKANGVKAYSLMKDFADFEWIEGSSAIDLSISAIGKNQAQLVQTLGGKMAIKFTNGALRGVDVDKLLGDVSKNVLSGWNRSPKDRTRFTEMFSNFNIVKGRASTNSFKFIGPKVKVSGKGNVNLPPRTLNFRFSPTYVASLQGKETKSPIADVSKLPIKVKGPWDNPKIYPDVKGILENPALAYQTIDGLLKSSGGLKNTDTKALVKDTQKKTVDKVEKAVAKEIGDENAKELTKTGKKLLKSLFGD